MIRRALPLGLMGLIVLVFCGSLPAKEQILCFDFGYSQRESKFPWNNVSGSTSSGLALSGSLDTTGQATSVAVRQLDPFCGYNLAGSRKSDPLPETASSDSFYLEKGIDEHAVVQFEGLTPGGTYIVQVFASRMEGEGESRVGTYQIGNQQMELDASDNVDCDLRFEDIQATEEGKLTLTVDCASDSMYAYLGAVQIRGEFPPLVESKFPADDLEGPPLVSAAAYAIADGETGDILWSKNADQVRAMASTTKIMTALTVLEICADHPERLREKVTFSQRADSISGTSAKMVAGESAVGKELLYGLLLPSGNDAGIALAEHYGKYLQPGDNESAKSGDQAKHYDRFVARMNRRAEELGMTGTVYLDPHGNSANRSTAQDLVKLAVEARKQDLLREIVGTRRYSGNVIQADGTRRMIPWKNTNQLLDIEGFDGIKTGTTGAAGECLVSTGVRDGQRLIIVVLGANRKSRFLDSRNLYRWAWAELAKETVTTSK